MPGRFGGVAIEEEPKSRFGGVAVDDSPSSPSDPSGPSQNDLDKFMRDRYNGPNPARNRRQKSTDAGLTPLQIWKRSQGLSDLVKSAPGEQDVERGVREIQTPGQRKEGLHHLITGGGKAAAIPFLAPALATAPIPTAYALGTGMLASEGGRGIAKLAGAADDTADLVGDAAGFVGGGSMAAPGEAGAAARGGVRAATESIPIVGRILKGAWQRADSIGESLKAAGAKREFNAGQREVESRAGQMDRQRPAPAPSSDVPRTASGRPLTEDEISFRDAGREQVPSEIPPAGSPAQAPDGRRPAWEGNPAPQPRRAPDFSSTPSELPSGRKVGPAPKAAPGSPNASEQAVPGATGPKKAPENTAELDAVAKGLGAKDFKSLNAAQQETVRKLAAPKAAPTPAASPQGPVPAPTTQSAPSNEVPKAEGPPAKSKTIREMIDDDLAKRKASAPVPAPTSPAVTKAETIKRAAADLHEQGITADHLLTLTPEQRTQALGQHADALKDIVAELRSHVSRGKMDTARGAKDAAMAKFFEAKGISADQVAAMDENTLGTHVKSAGYRIPGKSGALGRSHLQLQHDIVDAMRGQANGSPAVAPPAPAAPAAPVSQSLPAQPGSANKGVTATVRTPAQTAAKVQYRISEAKDLKTSFDPDYNTEIGHQPRDTTRLASRQRVEARKADMDPNAMGHSVMAGDGAPITKQGNAVTRNHGMQALKENYAGNPTKSQQYKDWVSENAGLAGMSPEDVAAMKEPILHRELAEDWDHAKVKQFADEANMSSTARMSEAELAKQMAQHLAGPKMGRFKVNDNGVPDAEFVREMIKELPVEEQAEFSQRNGEISQKGVRLVRNAVFERAYTSTKALETMAESTAPQVKNISNAMLNAAPEHARLADAIASGDAYDLSIGRDVGKAMETIERLRQEKKSVPDWLKQGDMGGRDPAVSMLVHMLAEESRRPTVMRDMLNNYAKQVFSLGKPNQGGLFGEVKLPSKMELLEEAYQSALKARDPKDPEESLFGAK